MVDKETKRKLRRIWCARLVIGGLYVPVTLGFSIVELQSVCREVNSTWKTTQTVQQAKLAEQLAKKMVVQKEQAQQQAMEQAKQSQLQAKHSSGLGTTTLVKISVQVCTMYHNLHLMS